MKMKRPWIRNPVARSPILRKGGPHTKSKTGQRVKARLSTTDALDEWFIQSEYLREDSLNKEFTSKEKQKGEPDPLC